MLLADMGAHVVPRDSRHVRQDGRRQRGELATGDRDKEELVGLPDWKSSSTSAWGARQQRRSCWQQCAWGRAC